MADEIYQNVAVNLSERLVNALEQIADNSKHLETVANSLKKQEESLSIISGPMAGMVQELTVGIKEIFGDTDDGLLSLESTTSDGDLSL